MPSLTVGLLTQHGGRSSFASERNPIVSCGKNIRFTFSIRLLGAQTKIEVYTDGQCNLCRWMRARVEPLDRNHRIEWLDYNDTKILQRAAPHTREEMAEEMHTRTADGRWRKGYFAWIEVIRVLSRWKWLAPVLSLWPFTKLGPVFYRWLASRRYTLFGVPPPCDASGVCRLHK